MADFYGTDPKGRVVVLRDSTFRHVIVGHPELEPHRSEIEEALVTPDVIMSNAATFGRGTYQKERTADVQYIRYSSAVRQHIVVPVKLESIELPSGENESKLVDGGSARTAYPRAQLPTNTRVLYRRST